MQIKHFCVNEKKMQNNKELFEGRTENLPNI